MSELKSLLLLAFPSEPPSDLARSKVRDLAAQADLRLARRTRAKFRVRVAAGIGLVTAAVVLGLIVIPVVAAQAYVAHVRQLVDDAKTAHFIEYAVKEDGSRVKAREIWVDRGRWRIEWPSRHETTIADGQRQWTYREGEKKAWVRPSSGSPFGYGPRGFKMSAMIGEARGRRVDITQVGGLKRVSIRSDIEPVVFTLWVDPRSDLPVRGQIEDETPHGRKLASVLEFTFDRPLASALFKPTFPAGTQVVDVNEDRATWQSKFEKSLAVFGDRLTIRNVQVSADGDVFLLYTGRWIVRENLKLTDSHGAKYLACDLFQPSMTDTQGKRVRGFWIDGEPLYGAWWTPLYPTRWHARTMTFSAEDVSVHFDPEKMKHWPKDRPVPASAGAEVRKSIGLWSWTSKEPTCETIPDYMPLMALAPTDATEVRRLHDQARFQYLHFRGRYAEAEPYLRDQIEIMRRAEREEGVHWQMRQELYMMYLNLKLQGRHDEAIFWLRQTLNQPGSDPNVDAALRREGLR